jgi:hypothetical protein
LILKLHKKKVATSVLLFVSTFTICQLPRSAYHPSILLVLDADADADADAKHCAVSLCYTHWLLVAFE